MISVNSYLEPPADWDDWLIAQGYAAGFCQSVAWSIVNQRANGVVNYWLEAVFEGNCLGRMLVSHRKPDLSKMSSVEKIYCLLSGSDKGSHVLNEILEEEDLNKPSLRFSFSKYNTKEDIDYTVEVLKDFTLK